MINYLDSNTIDFIEYRELKKGIDINLYLEMDILSFTNIYERTSMEIEYRFNELIDLDKKLSALKRKSNLTIEEKMAYEECISLGQSNYERYSFLEDKLNTLDEVRNIKGWKLLNEIDCKEDNKDITLSDDELASFFNAYIDDDTDDDKF